MKATIRLSSIAIGAGLVAMLAWQSATAVGQIGSTPVPKSPPTGPAPRLASGKPDLSGVWQVPYVPDMTRNGPNQQGYAELPFTPAGLQNWKSYDPADGDYTGSCLPYGLPRSINSPYPIRIMQTDTHVALLFELNTWFHVVALDGRQHSKNLNPTWFGESVGKWEGDTLVVDTIGFNGYTRLDTVGHPHSDALHLVLRLRRTDAGHLNSTITVDDPKMYTRPWTNERTFTLMADDLIEYSCEENNKDLRDGHIKAWTPPWVREQKN